MEQIASKNERQTMRFLFMPVFADGIYIGGGVGLVAGHRDVDLLLSNFICPQPRFNSHQESARLPSFINHLNRKIKCQRISSGKS
jgi:hypothetical protein